MAVANILGAVGSLIFKGILCDHDSSKGDFMEVTAAVFIKNDQVLLMRRAPGNSSAGGWEYPGGKIESGETGEQCLKRELFEELCIEAEIGDLMAESTFSTTSKTIHLYAYFIKNYYGAIQLTVHDNMEWVPIHSLLTHDQLPADYIISQKLLEVL